LVTFLGKQKSDTARGKNDGLDYKPTMGKTNQISYGSKSLTATLSYTTGIPKNSIAGNGNTSFAHTHIPSVERACLPVGFLWNITLLFLQFSAYLLEDFSR
jgi:hypothetical protein